MRFHIKECDILSNNNINPTAVKRQTQASIDNLKPIAVISNTEQSKNILPRYEKKYFS